MRGKIGEGDKEVTIEARIRVNRADMFRNFDKEDIDVHFYLGHANYGRNVPTSLTGAPTGTGEGKLFFFGCCFGKANMQHVYQRYPLAQHMATFESAYAWELFSGMGALLDGIAERSPWTTISRNIGEGFNNFVTPADVMLRRRILDRDNDGRADVLDRLYDVNLQRVDESLREGLKPRDPGAPPHRLQALSGVIACNWINRGAGGYNEAIRARNDRARVSCAGFYPGTADAAPVRFETVTLPDGEPGWTMSINPYFAHMPEEVMRVVAVYEYNQHLAGADERFHFHADPLRAKLNGLMAVAFTLSHDLFDNDGTVWRAFLDAYGFPTLELHEVEEWALKLGADNRDQPAGSRENIDAWLTDLREHAPALVRELESGTAGAWLGGH
jgi:hypothetical protein